VRDQGRDGCLYIGQICAEAVGPLGGAHADEVDVAERGRLGVVGGEAQSTGREVALEDVVQAGLVDRHLASAEHLDLASVDIDPEHFVAQLGETDRVRGAKVSGTDEGQSRSRHVLRGARRGLQDAHTVSARVGSDGAKPRIVRDRDRGLGRSERLGAATDW